MMRNSQRGSGHLFSLMVIGLIVWGAYVTVYVPYEHRKSMDEFRSNPPAVSPAKMAVIDTYKAKPAPTQLPHGVYTGSVEQDGYPMTISFTFGDDGQITKKAHIKTYDFSASARYRLDGAVMLFSDVKGDAVLFPQPGEPLEVISDSEIHIPGPDKPLVLKRQ